MVEEALDFVVYLFFPALLELLDGLIIIPGVSFIGFTVAVTVLCCVLGALLFRS